MRRVLLAVSLLAAAAAHADDFAARALLSYENRSGTVIATSGVRQQYDLHLDKVLTTTSLVRLYCRVDDFRGTQDYASVAERNRSRQIQPVAELVLNTDTLQAMARSDWLDVQSTFADTHSKRAIQRSLAQLTWQPVSLPVFHVLGARNATRDDRARTRLTDDNFLGSVQYNWRGLQASGEERYFRSADPEAGYDRKTTSHVANVTWASTHLGGKLSVAAGGEAQLIALDERAVVCVKVTE